MQAQYVVFPKINEVRLETETLDPASLQGSEVIVRSETSIISTGTELARLRGTEIGGRGLPARPGYGTIGRVETVGPDVKDFKPGDRVFFAGKHASRQKFLHNQNHQWGLLYPAPEGIDAANAVFVTMISIAMTAPDVTELRLNDTVAVFGLGLVGNLAAQMYSIAGAKVIALDPVRKRCEIAKRCGIATAIDAPPEKQVEAVMDLTGGRGANVTVDAAGHSAVILTAIHATARFGQVILVGSPRAPYSADMTPAMYRVHEQGLVVRGAHMWRIPPKPMMEAKYTVGGNLAKSFELVGSGRINVRELRSHLIRPEQVPDTYARLQTHPDEYVAAVIDWR